MVALVGLTGAGKTTLVSLIPRFYDATAGRVLIDGVDVRRLPRSDRCASRSRSCLQDPVLFSGTIADNLRYGRLDATDGRDRGGGARGARARVHLAPARKATRRRIAEAGGSLSGGERQRLSVARAILKNAPILILDEPTSSLDAISEEIVFAALRRLRAGRTTIVIAHRLSTVRDADCILVLDGGRIAAQGRHDDLLKSSQLYRRMCARLSVGKSLDDPETVDELIRGREEMTGRRPARLTAACHENPLRGHHRPLPVRRRDVVLADVPARPARARPRGLLHRRHRRVRVRPGAEHARDRSLVRHHLHPQRARAVRPRRSLGVRQLRRQLSRPERRRRAAVLRRRRPLHQPLGRIVVLARRIRAHPAEGRSSIPTRRSRSSPSRRPNRGTSSSSSGSITCSRSDRTSARRHRRSRRATSRGTRPGSRSRSTTGAATRAAPDRFHVGDDVADRELHGRRRQQGSGIREIHRPAVADARSHSSWRSTDRRSCCANTAGRRSTRWASRARSATIASSSSDRRRSSASPSTPTSRRDRAGSAIAPSAISRRDGPALVQDTGWTAHLPHGEGLLAFSTPDEALAGIDRINSDYVAHARRALEIAREHFDAPTRAPDAAATRRCR